MHVSPFPEQGSSGTHRIRAKWILDLVGFLCNFLILKGFKKCSKRTLNKNKCQLCSQLESLTLKASVRVGSYFPVTFVGFSLRIGTMGLEGILGVIS